MAPIKVLVVDDSVVVRRLVTTALEGDPDISVMATASNGRLAIQRLEQGLPDVVTLDIEMPEMNGLEAMKEIHKRWPRLPVIMFSTLTEKGASSTLEALSSGASDYVTKPSNVGSITESMASVRDQVVPKIKALAGRRPGGASPPRPAPGTAAPAGRTGFGALPPQRPTPSPAAPRSGPLAAAPTGSRFDILAIGCSTGGPEALTTVLKGFPRDLPVPVVVVQHMPPVFTKLFADRLESGTALTVHEATDGMTLAPGHVYIAPGDHHLVVKANGAGVSTSLNQGPPENFCRPAVDPMFRSVATTYGSKTLACVLTGMGSDGKLGAGILKSGGAHVVAQDEATSVVWGMPGAVTTAGHADAVLPLLDIAPYLLAALRGGRGPGRAAAGAATASRSA